MSEKTAVARLRREYLGIQSQKIPHVVARPTENDLLVWHYVLHDLAAETPYAGGVYWGKVIFPKEYPLKPPSIKMLTPSGRFATDTRLCLSMSDFHPETWNPAWRMESILVGLVSFMLDPAEPPTTGGVSASADTRRHFAKASFDFNRGHTEFRELFPEFCDESKRNSSGAFCLEKPSNVAVDRRGDGAVPGDQANGTAAERKIETRQGNGEQGGFSPLWLLSVVVLLVACVSFMARPGNERT